MYKRMTTEQLKLVYSLNPFPVFTSCVSSWHSAHATREPACQVRAKLAATVLPVSKYRVWVLVIQVMTLMTSIILYSEEWLALALTWAGYTSNLMLLFGGCIVRRAGPSCE